MPHSAQSDEDVAAVYEALDDGIQDARKKGYTNISAGDFNAEVGTRSEDDDVTVIGKTPFLARSERGSWLVSWCTLRYLVLTNTFGWTSPLHGSIVMARR